MAFDPVASLDELNLLGQPGAAPPAQKQGFDRSKILRLIPLVAAAAKGGPGAMEGLLSGYQQAEAAKQQQATQQAQTQRQSMLDQRTLANDQFTHDLQLRQQQQKEEADRAGLVQEFTKALNDENLTDPEAVRALTQLYESRGRALGVRPGTFETTAMQMVKPSALETKAARKKVNELRTQFGVGWMDEGAKFQHDLPGGKRVSFQELLSLAGMTTDPNYKAPTPADKTPPAVGSFEDYVKRKYGDAPTPEQIVAARKAYQQADDRPQPQATILIQTLDASGNPVQRLVPRTPGTEFAVQPTASQQTALAEQETGIALIGSIERLYKPQYVGPVVGRATKAQMQIPGTPDVSPDVAEFYSAVANLRNEIIRLMSGAAVSGAEEQRMKAQLPDVTDKPSVFVSKLTQTRKNRETLLARTLTRSGQPGVAPMPSHGTTPRRIGRFEIVSEQ